jgi:hypothetical protein
MFFSLLYTRFRACLLLCLGGLLGSLCVAATPGAAPGALVEQGRRIYAEGVRVSGEALQATRASGAALRGRDAACTNCHRASGMGSVEGSVRVPPISQRYLFAEADDLVMANVDGRRGKTLNRGLEGYTDATLTRLLQDGVTPAGRQVSDVMPHFNLQADDLLALRSYLQQLSSDYAPGVGKDVIHFAAVITPEVSEARRSVFKAMLQSALAAKNSSTSPRKRYMTTAASFVTQTERRWDVQVWELRGAPDSWGAQLAARYAATPVFALLSGVSDGNWAPVDAFCRNQAVPCWFPSTALPATGEARYGQYFSRGVALEAEVLARYLAEAKAAPARRILQVFTADNAAAQAGAAALRQALPAHAVAAPDIALPADPVQALARLRAALHAAHAGDSIALWLAPQQLHLLDTLTPPAGVQLLASGSLGQDASWAALPAAWQPALRVVYPYALPQERAANLAYLHAWLKLRDIPLVDEALQSELFFALNLMTDTLQDMLDNLYRDYLLERSEDMLGKRESAKAQQESRDRQTLGRLGRAAVASEHGAAVPDALDAAAAQRRAYGVGDSEGTTVYPHLTLGPGQRYASRGAYIVRVAPGPAHTLEAVSDWIVP